MRYGALMACVGILAMATAGSAVAADRSCRHTAGAKEAARLANECRQVAESAHWPCHVSNSCGEIVRAIRKGCADLNYGQPDIKPHFCRAYLRK